SGMGGIRTSGDLVARVMSKGRKIREAKEYVAKKLGVSTFDLSDESLMKELREEFNIGHVLARPGAAIGMEAKIRIAKLLDIEINSVNRFRSKSGLG
ncbi:MAG: hypothetical protein M0T74_10240, partial [Desulfitobacterium hafniense]|nr:hypothetical protein [Desulfitobacterium hafniense]